MASVKWPASSKLKYITKKDIDRLDGPPKTKGEAKYAYDIQRPQMLIAKILSSPHAHARITSIDISAAQQMPGVKAVNIMSDKGTEIQWEGFEIASVAAETEDQARDAVRAIKVEFEVLPHHVNAVDFDTAPAARKGEPQVSNTGDVETAFAAASAKIEGRYGLATVAHCCLETHGQVAEWTAADRVKFWPSTQSVSGYSGQVAQTFNIPASNVEVSCQFMGGGFGSKFAVDRWGLECARLAKMAGRPVKLMLDRNQELMIAGMRPSAYATVKIAADRRGNLIGWESMVWGSSGMTGRPNPPLPYVFTNIPNKKLTNIPINTNVGPARAWRAPNHPQAAVITMTALDDLSAALNLDPYEFFLRNLGLTARENIYKEEMAKAAEMFEWKKKWHPRGQGGDGPVKRGVGMSIHTWAGSGHASNCIAEIHSDGRTEIRIGTQDLGTGTRTVLAIVGAETFGIGLADVTVRIGENSYPQSGASGGSSTIGGISSSSRRACTAALNKLFETVAPFLGAKPEELEAVEGTVRVAATPTKSMTWKEAAAKIGPTPISVSADRDKPGEPEPLYSANVGGVQMIEVTVDTDTGVVRVENVVAVQDAGLIISLKTSESQVYGSVIMGLCSALYEESLVDEQTGRMLNPSFDYYKLAGIGDIGRVQVHMMTGPGYDERGPVGLGEPPVNSPVACVSNAIANAIGVRVPYGPFTPDRVLAALEKGGRA